MGCLAHPPTQSGLLYSLVKRRCPLGAFLEKDKLLSASGEPHNPRSTFTADKDSDWLHMEQHKLPGRRCPPNDTPNLFLLVYELTNPHSYVAQCGRFRVFFFFS